MDIQKVTAYSARVLAEIKQLPEPAVARNAGPSRSRTGIGSEKSDIGAETRNSGGVAAPDTLKAVLNHLDQLAKLRDKAEEQRAGQYQTIPSARTKYALNAYLAQSDLPQYEAKNALSQMLGVDDYA
ncbi:hypothetical protein ACWJKU_04935 [Methylocaldum sp. MU1018]